MPPIRKPGYKRSDMRLMMQLVLAGMRLTLVQMSNWRNRVRSNVAETLSRHKSMNRMLARKASPNQIRNRITSGNN
jgi:hypothetical protein